MILSHKELLNLPVETKNGQRLGSVCGFEFDVDTQKISRYYVKSHKLVSSLLVKELIIHAEQIINITSEKMVVEDGVVKNKKMVQDTVAPASM